MIKSNYLKSLIFNILKNKSNKINYNNVNKLIVNNKLQKFNSNNSHFINNYKFNNNNLLNNLFIDYNINYLFNILFYQKNYNSNKLNKLNINISYPYFYHSLNNLNILLFIYVPSHIIKLNNNNINTNNLIISRIIKRLFNNNLNNNNIINLLNPLYNKNVNIEPIFIKYSYMNSIILSKILQQQINVIHKFKGKYAQTINNRIPLININNIIQYNYKIKNMLNWILTLNSFINNNNNDKLYNTINLNNNILPLMLNQYIIGYNWQYKGKIQQSESNARSLKHNERYGIFNSQDHVLYKNTFNLLYKPTGLTYGSTWNTNKNGIFNIKVTLSHI